MITPTVRPTVVLLLLDIDFGAVRGEPSRWQRLNGEMLTDAERSLAGSANEAELVAAMSLSKERRARVDELDDAWIRLNELVAAYSGAVPQGTPIVQISLLFTPEEKAEFDRLLDLVAPGGGFFVPYED